MSKSDNKKTKEELLAEIEFLKKGGIAEQVGITIQVLVKYCALGYAFWCLKESMQAFAGQTSDANIVVSLLADVNFSEAVAWVFGLGAFGYGYQQRKLKGQTVQRLTSRITELEKKLDPSRTSSELTSTGETNPKDEA